MLTLAEIGFDTTWLLKEPPAVIHSYPSRDANVRVCRGSEDGSYVIGLLCPFVLTGKSPRLHSFKYPSIDYIIYAWLVTPPPPSFNLSVASTFYAIKTRKCPEGFNETRRIAFANYATIVLWLAFVPLYLASSSNAVRVITLALSLSLNGFVQLLSLFLPKVYVVLMKPEKNTRELVMARHVGSAYPTAPVTPETASASPSFGHSSKLSHI